MLLELDIDGLAVLRHAALRFAPGLNALTGPTGAGKSLVARAVALAAGARARPGEAGARVRALFAVGERARARSLVEVGDEGVVLLERSLDDKVRSRCRIDGRLVPLKRLSAVGGALADVLGQHETALLADPAHRIALVDLFGGLDPTSFREARRRVAELRGLLSRNAEEARERRRRADFLRFLAEEIDAVAPEKGEFEALEAERLRLEHAEELRRLGGGAVEELYERDGSVVERLAALGRLLESLEGRAGGLLDEASEALSHATRAIEDLVSALRRLLDGLDADPRRLEEVRDRLDALHALIRKHGERLEDVFEARAALAADLEALAEREEEDGELPRRLERAEEELDGLARELDAARLAAARRLARETEHALAGLGMERARLTARCVPLAREARLPPVIGPSRVDFLLAADPKFPARPLEDVASGGETARIALALRAALARAQDVAVLVFDEVESGVGARLGAALARTLRGIARRRQVLVVTHLPQVAAAADRHLAVHKGVDGASVRELSGEDRVEEIAQMMGGDGADRSARREARKWLERAGGVR